ncbi:hypothetical protein [Halobacterium noricense]|uniref:hypothetical protein n=1 Tax=Halobacterium noricense TaxID=223182 RepID=UPI001E4395A4|nr:hypothetical protein [Halobacterium noricense]UHH26075.1 hypothetical protein LT974_03855 [Halobacterium noricense]
MNVQSRNPTVFAVVAASVSAVLYVALAVLVSGNAFADAALPAAATALGVGFATFYVRRAGAQ